MKIALYSEFAREHIVKIRTEIAKLGLGSSDEEMKAFRDMLIRSNQDHHKLILKSGDFYSLSSLRDLLFHEKEHRFTIPKIQDYLDKLELKFCGFEMSRVVSKFKQKNKNKDDLFNLGKWQIFEEQNPLSFVAMYQFWCQKIT